MVWPDATATGCGRRLPSNPNGGSRAMVGQIRTRRAASVVVAAGLVLAASWTAVLPAARASVPNGVITTVAGTGKVGSGGGGGGAGRAQPGLPLPVGGAGRGPNRI